MRIKLTIIAISTSILAACGGTPSDGNESTSTTTPAVTEPAAVSGDILISQSDCVSCHAEQEKLIGPSYVEIAQKYPTNEANIALLADKIINGGKGTWGSIPMTPHKNLAEDDAKAMAKYILSLKK